MDPLIKAKLYRFLFCSYEEYLSVIKYFIKALCNMLINEEHKNDDHVFIHYSKQFRHDICKLEDDVTYYEYNFLLYKFMENINVNKCNDRFNSIIFKFLNEAE